MRDLSEKYIALRDDFPNRAGTLRKELDTQKRLLQTVMRQTNTQECQQLLISIAAGYDAGITLLDYVYSMMKGVAEDATALMEGSEIRNVNRMQALDIRRNWDKLDEMTALIVEINALKRKLAEHGIA